MSDMDILPKHVRDADAYEPPDLPALRETVERRRRCGCEKCEGCGSDRDALVNAAPALLDELERERIENTRLREAFVTMERAYNRATTDRDISMRKRGELEADLAAARAVLDGAEVVDHEEPKVLLTADLTAWMVWQGRSK
jgi:hypothetical protein